MDNKRLYILETLRLMREALKDNEMTNTLNKMADSVVHTAPEIIDRRWTTIYNFCSQHVNNMKNPAHKECYDLYHDRLIQYTSLYS